MRILPQRSLQNYLFSWIDIIVHYPEPSSDSDSNYFNPLMSPQPRKTARAFRLCITTHHGSATVPTAGWMCTLIYPISPSIPLTSIWSCLQFIHSSTFFRRFVRFRHSIATEAPTSVLPPSEPSYEPSMPHQQRKRERERERERERWISRVDRTDR